MRLQNEEVGAFRELWSVSKGVFVGTEGTLPMKTAVHQLAKTLQSGKIVELKRELDANGSSERKHMLTIVKYLLRPLLGDGADSVVLNRAEYSTVAPQDVQTKFLGIGNVNTWHGAPDCRCDIVDVVNLDSAPDDDNELSETESSGSKTSVEVKAVSLTVRHLHQMVGLIALLIKNGKTPWCRFWVSLGDRV